MPLPQRQGDEFCVNIDERTLSPQERHFFLNMLFTSEPISLNPS